MKYERSGKQTNREHGEENVQMKEHAYVHRWVDHIKWKEFGVVNNMFKQYIKKEQKQIN